MRALTLMPPKAERMLAELSRLRRELAELRARSCETCAHSYECVADDGTLGCGLEGGLLDGLVVPRGWYCADWQAR